MTSGTASALRQLLAPVAADLARVEAEITRMLATNAPPVQALVEHVGRFAGKRLRPALTVLAGRIAGGVTPAHHTVGAIVECIHTATLVHDDILDESRMRRRVATINARIGNETAVLLGDYMFATCFKEAASLDDRFASRYLSEIVGVVCRGEILQVHHRNDFELDEPTYFRIIEDKTAALYVAALRCGGHLAGATPDVLDALVVFGSRMGTAFQIVDDILDLTGTEESVGKSLGTDLDKAKMTLPLLRLRDAANPADRERLRAAILTGDESGRALVPELMARYDALAAARATADKLVADAHSALDRLPETPERELLRRAAEYVLVRNV